MSPRTIDSVLTFGWCAAAGWCGVAYHASWFQWLVMFGLWFIMVDQRRTADEARKR